MVVHQQCDPPAVAGGTFVQHHDKSFTSLLAYGCHAGRSAAAPRIDQGLVARTVGTRPSAIPARTGAAGPPSRTSAKRLGPASPFMAMSLMPTLEVRVWVALTRPLYGLVLE